MSAALAAPIGSAVIVVNNVTGKVEQVAEGTLLRAGSDVQQDETIETAAASATRLIFQDNTKLEIGAFSQVRLDRLIYDPDPERSQVALSILKGSARFTSGLLPKRDYEIHTPGGAAVGVRGTILVIDLGPNGTTTIFVEKGIVDATGGGVTIELHNGQSTIVPFRGVPGAPVTGPNPRPFRGLPALKQAALSPRTVAALLGLHPEGGTPLIDLVAYAIEENPGLASLIIDASQTATTAQQLALGAALGEAKSYFAGIGDTAAEQQLDAAMALAPAAVRTMFANAGGTNSIFDSVIGTTGNTPTNRTGGCISPSQPGDRC